MSDLRGAISDTSPLIYLYRIGSILWLAHLFDDVLIPGAVRRELEEGQRLGYDVPDPPSYEWMHFTEPSASLPPEHAPGLGAGELSVLALAQEHPERVVLLDDALARRRAQEMSLEVWGTLRVMLEAKRIGLTDQIAPLVSQLAASGMWLSDDIRLRILRLAGEG